MLGVPAHLRYAKPGICGEVVRRSVMRLYTLFVQWVTLSLIQKSPHC